MERAIRITRKHVTIFFPPQNLCSTRKLKSPVGMLHQEFLTVLSQKKKRIFTVGMAVKEMHLLLLLLLLLVFFFLFFQALGATTSTPAGLSG